MWGTVFVSFFGNMAVHIQRKRRCDMAEIFLYGFHIIAAAQVMAGLSLRAFTQPFKGKFTHRHYFIGKKPLTKVV